MSAALPYPPRPLAQLDPLRAKSVAGVFQACNGRAASLHVVLATTDGRTVDATLETAASLVRYRITAEDVVFVDLVGHAFVTRPTCLSGLADVFSARQCDLVVATGSPAAKPAKRVPSVFLEEPTPFDDVITAIQRALDASLRAAPEPL